MLKTGGSRAAVPETSRLVAVMSFDRRRRGRGAGELGGVDGEGLGEGEELQAVADVDVADAAGGLAADADAGEDGVGEGAVGDGDVLGGDGVGVDADDRS